MTHTTKSNPLGINQFSPKADVGYGMHYAGALRMSPSQAFLPKPESTETPDASAIDAPVPPEPTE